MYKNRPRIKLQSPPPRLPTGLIPFQQLISEEVFPSQERVSGFPEKGADLRGSLPGNFWIAVKFHSERTSGEVTEKLPGKFGEPPGKSEDFPEAWGSLTPSQ